MAKASSNAGGLGQPLPVALMAVGLVALLAGGWLFYSGLSSDSGGGADTAARSSIDEIGGTIAQVREALANPAAGEAARAALEGTGDISAVRRQLQSAGVANLLDVRVFGPNVEEIEVGSYPEPDFSVVQMLIEARTQGNAPAEVHYAGTANENLAFARALYAPDSGDEARVVGYLFVRLPVSVVTRRLAEPAESGWLALQQGETVIASKGSRPADRAPDGQATIAGSRLRLNWTSGAAAGGGSPMAAGAAAVLGVLLLAGGVVLRRRSEAAETAAPEADAPVEAEPAAAPPRSSRKRASDSGPDTEEQQKLPDWMLDEQSNGDGDDPFADSGGARKEAAGKAKRPEADVPFDVPDLDEIYQQIDSEKKPSDEAKSAESSDESTAGDDDDRTPLDSDDFDLSEDTINPEDEVRPETEFEPEEADLSEAESEPAAEDESQEPEDSGLDLDFAFSDRPSVSETPEDEEAPEESETAEQAPRGEGLELALEDDNLQGAEADQTDQPDQEEDSAAEDDEADWAALERELASAPGGEESGDEPEESDLSLELESQPESEPETEPDTESEPQMDAEVESEDVRASAPARTVAESTDESDASAVAGTDLPSGIFRPGDILGEVDEDLTPAVATDVGQAIGSLMHERGFSKVAVARDGRFSGPILLSALIRGLRNSGMDVVEIGAVPTPMLWFAATELADGCGVMVTASHHPPKYNGFRMMAGGELLGPEAIADVARRFESKDFAKGEGSYEQRDMLEAYGKRLTTDIQLERPLKVVVDCGNGVGGAVAPKLLQAIGADLIPLYCDVDGAFPNHRPDPSSPDDLEDLRLCVRNFQAELGIAFDGDADRLALVTRNGEIIWPDRLLMLLAESVLSGRPGEAVVYDVRCSGHLQSIVEQAGGRGVMTASGQRALARRLVKEDAPLGGEMNGHLIINDRWYPFDDALYAAARLLEVIAADSRDIDEILAEQPSFKASPEIVVSIDRDRSQSLVERLGKESDFGDALLTRIDGLRADWSDRWGLARVDADTGDLVLRFGGDEATALGKVRSEFREKLLELDSKLPLPY